LVADLEGLGHAHDFVEVEPYGGWSWEKTTLRKAHEAGKAMDRHPNKLVVFLDVDARVLRPLDDLVNRWRGDVGFYIRTSIRKTGGVKIRIRSGTMVLANTPQARHFVDVWEAESRSAPRGEVDQAALQVALGKQLAATYRPLPLEYCATEGDRCHNPAILHDQASKGVRKVGNWQKRWWYLTGQR